MRAIVLALALLAPAVAGAASSVPAAIAHDPPVDPRHPASGGGFQFHSHGELINAQLYRPAGAGAHPTVILCHGLPGNEQNLDLARALQRAGWTVITFHYRGARGSGGTFHLKDGADDVPALLADLADPAKAAALGVDPARIVLMGHSYGGYVAAHAAAEAPKVIATVLIAPWDPAYDRRAWSKVPAADLAKTFASALDDVDGRLTGATHDSLGDEILHGDLDLATTAPGLASRPLLIVNATRDDPDDQAVDLLPALKAAHAGKLTVRTLVTDHGFNDQRIALETVVVRWVAHLPGAPRTP